MSLLSRLIARAAIENQNEPMLETKDGTLARYGQDNVYASSQSPLDQSTESETAFAIRRLEKTDAESTAVEDEQPNLQAVRRTSPAEQEATQSENEEPAQRASKDVDPDSETSDQALSTLRRKATEMSDEESDGAIAPLRATTIARAVVGNNEEELKTPPEFSGTPETKVRRQVSREALLHSVGSSQHSAPAASFQLSPESTLNPAAPEQGAESLLQPGEAGVSHWTDPSPVSHPDSMEQKNAPTRPQVNIGQIDVIVQEEQASASPPGFFERHAKRLVETRYLRRL
jgi:hypothetical protein